MTLGELKAFLEGMDIKEAPTPEQWERIVKKINALKETKEVMDLFKKDRVTWPHPLQPLKPIFDPYKYPAEWGKFVITCDTTLAPNERRMETH